MYKKDDAQNNEVRKSRTQKFRDFFESLQLEYIVAELRYRIYPDGDRRKKSADIMSMKREKIFNIALQNCLKTIFPDCSAGSILYYDPELRKKLYATVYSERGFPNFIYRDDLHRKQLEHLDRKYYYTVGSLFSTDEGKGGLVSINGDTVTISIAGKNKQFKAAEVSRVL